MKPDFTQPWYHGSPTILTTLRTGSTVTQQRSLACVFSHKPTLVVQAVDEHGQLLIKHTGNQPGFLYQVVDVRGAGDVKPHPRTSMTVGQEWLTRRPLQLVLLEPTTPKVEELLTDEEIAALQARLQTGKAETQN